MDLVNEFLNKEFITGLKGTSTLSEVTVARHGALVGGVKRQLRRIYDEAAGDIGRGPSRGRSCDPTDDILKMINLYKSENLFSDIPGRAFKGCPEFTYDMTISKPAMFIKRLKKLAKRLDRRRRLVAN